MKIRDLQHSRANNNKTADVCDYDTKTSVLDSTGIKMKTVATKIHSKFNLFYCDQQGVCALPACCQRVGNGIKEVITLFLRVIAAFRLGTYMRCTPVCYSPLSMFSRSSIFIQGVSLFLLTAVAANSVLAEEPAENAVAQGVKEEPPAEVEIYDPIEPVNRGIFWFNDTFDVYLLEPVSRGYDFVVPNGVQHSVTNFFRNLKFPAFFVSDVVQFKFDQAAVHTGRFLINTTIGVAGLFDVAEEFGLEHHYEDFGTALGYRGVPSGPYIVIPFLGPSNARDACGRIVDAFLNPVFYLDSFTDLSSEEAFAISAGLYGLDAINTRADLLEAVETAKSASLDYYLFLQSAYYQLRANQIYDNNPPRVRDEDADFEEEVTPAKETK